MFNIAILVGTFGFGVWIGMKKGLVIRDWLRDKLRSIHGKL